MKSNYPEKYPWKFSRKSNLTILNTTINPGSDTLRKILGKQKPKFIILTNNARLAQMAYDYFQDKPACEVQLLWAPKTKYSVLQNILHQLPPEPDGIEALILTQKNLLTGTVMTDDAITYETIDLLCDMAVQPEYSRICEEQLC